MLEAFVVFARSFILPLISEGLIVEKMNGVALSTKEENVVGNDLSSGAKGRNSSRLELLGSLGRFMRLKVKTPTVKSA